MAVEIIDQNNIFDYNSLDHLLRRKMRICIINFQVHFLLCHLEYYKCLMKKLKGMCTESIYNLLYKFRNSIFRNIISYEMFLG